MLLVLVTYKLLTGPQLQTSSFPNASFCPTSMQWCSTLLALTVQAEHLGNGRLNYGWSPSAWIYRTNVKKGWISFSKNSFHESQCLQFAVEN